MATETAIPRGVLSDAVKDRLLEQIVDGTYPPGSRIVETRVARELGTSQAPVREALRDLEALGVVEISPFRGARVRRPGLEELLEGYVVRAELEAMAVRLALPRLTARDLHVMAALLGQLQMKSADMAETITREMGCPISFSNMGQVMATNMVLDYYVGLTRSYAFEETRPGMLGSCLVRREPVGVAGCIVPWNVPFFVTMPRRTMTRCVVMT